MLECNDTFTYATATEILQVFWHQKKIGLEKNEYIHYAKS